MDNEFDKFLKEKLDSIADDPVTSPLWNKEKTWSKIESGLKQRTRVISIGWFYAAASLAFLLLLGSVVTIRNYSGQLTRLTKENSRLNQNLAIASQPLMQPEKQVVGNQIPRVEEKGQNQAMAQTKELIRQVIVRDTIIIRDTVTIVSYPKEPEPEQIAENISPAANDSTATLTAYKEKTNSIHFAIVEEAEKEDGKWIIKSRKLPQNAQNYKKRDNKIFSN